ncbi:anoctamin-6-like [Anthonomus grandis grandis]|uniref:anoctamin-6-like n=1 Tax=Anthonomus grandis grandis TaxID=2921223 RepID=UPI00216633A3|nr:anoctamin-6-like [Anthonomus grandis grandis]
MDKSEFASYFTDKKRKIDFVLIVDSDIRKVSEKYDLLQEYLNNIKAKGLQIEEEHGQVVEKSLCIKIHVPVPVLDKYVQENVIDLSCDNLHFKKEKPFTIFGLKIFQNDMMSITSSTTLFQRAPKTFSNVKPIDYTEAERILLAEKMLSTIPFSSVITDVGYKMLKSKGVIEAAYPLHDSNAKWTWDKPLTDRQILNRYWASLQCFYKQQPLNLIEKYHGSEVAFYFAWVGFYTSMLAIAAILSIVCLILSGVFYSYQTDVIIKEVCESTKHLCPICPPEHNCDMEPLKNSCHAIKISYALDNPATLAHSVVMCLWGILFVALWKRKQAMLKLRWNLNDINVDNSIRPEFIKSASITRISSITGRTEYSMSRCRKVAGYLMSALIYIAMFMLYILGILLVMYIRVNVSYYGKISKNSSYKEYLSTIQAFASAFLTTVVILILDLLKFRAAKRMTDFENPRTQIGYHTKYVTKIVFFAIADVFAPVFYLAYFKGHFYEHPGDATQWKFFGMIKTDVCTIPGCLVDLAIQIFTLSVMKNFVRLSKDATYPIFQIFCNKMARTTEVDAEPTQWERDYFLVEPKENFLFEEYISMILQYSLIALFIVAFPATPIVAFLNNVIELRFDAKKILTQYRRNIPRKVQGIEEWNTVIQILTILGAISSPLLLSYSSSLIPKAIYIHRHKTLKGYVNSTLSIYKLSDANSTNLRSLQKNQSSCHYYGKRHPPDHELKYERTGDFWHEVAVRTIFFVVLENVCLLVSLLINYIIPKIPRKVEIKLLEDQRILRKTKLQRSKSLSSLTRVNLDGTRQSTSKY